MSPRSAQLAPCHVVAQKGYGPGPTAGDRGAFFGSDAAPSFQAFGAGLQDHRLPWNMYQGQGSGGVGVLGWYGAEPVTISYAPKTKNGANIVALANVTSGTAMTLAGASTGITVASALSIWPGFPLNNVSAISAGLVIDSAPALVKFGRRFTQAFYDRSTMLGRAVSVTGTASGTGGHFIIKGYDIYGYAMSEDINCGAGVNTVNGKKAWKVITSVTPQFTDAHQYSVGTTDIIGLPLLANNFEDMLVYFGGNAITATTGFTAADTTSPATTTTGDVRGTYALQSASDGTKVLSIQITPSLSALATNLTTGLFGQPQV